MRRIRWSRSSVRRDCSDRSKACRNTGHDRNRTDGPGDRSVADVGALNTVPETGTALYAFVVVAVLHSVARGAPAVPDADGTAPHVVAVD